MPIRYTRDRDRSRCFSRLLALTVELSRRRGWVRLTDMAAHFRVSERTIRRDIYALRDCGIDIEFSGRDGRARSQFRAVWIATDLQKLIARIAT